LEGKTFVTHIVASNLTPKKRVEFERYKVVRPEWIVECVNAGKALPWNRYRLIEKSGQKTLFSTNKFDETYKSISSRSEVTVYGGGGLQKEGAGEQVRQSQESSSYPTPPELKSMEMGIPAPEEKLELSLSPQYPQEDLMDDLPSTLSPIEISSPKRESDLNAQTLYETNVVPDIPKAEAMADFPIKDLPEDIPISLGQQITIRSPQRPFSPVKTKADSRPASPFRTSSPAPVAPKEQDPSEYIPPKEEAAAISAAHNAALLANPSLRNSTVVNPDFIKTYFDQSRLHHLSTWKADLKNQMQQLTMQKARRQAKRTGPRTIMHIDFDCFFASVSLVLRPELKDKPVCVGHGGGKSGEIASCNYVARKFGIHNGMLYVYPSSPS